MISMRFCRRVGCGSPLPQTLWPPTGSLPSGLFPRLSVRVHHVTGFVLRGRENRNRRRPAELLDIVALDVVVLHPDRPRLRPLAVRPEGYIALDCAERMGVQVFGELVVVESLCRGDRVAEDLQFA
jgi:hypothetical protein